MSNPLGEIMQFTRFLLDNYLKTAEGSRILKFFQNLPKYIADGDKDNKVQNFIDKLLIAPLPDKWFVFDYEINKRNFINFEDFFQYVENKLPLLLEEFNWHYRDLIQEIPNLSLALFAESPQFAFPCLYPTHFFRIQELCDIFEIILPPLPKKADYKAKCLYYLKLCEAFYEYRLHHGLTPEEFCSLMYGFGQHFLSNPLANDTPGPLKSWLVGANPCQDHDYLQNLSSDSVRYWQGNPDTQPGDIILMYELAPYSSIRSIWRALTPGYEDPFRYYPGIM